MLAGAMPRSTPDLLLDTAERLFARHGIGNVSLRQIGAAAGQRNTSVALYHFGSKAALVVATFDRRLAEMNAHRRTLLDRLDAEGKGTDARALTRVLVVPFAHTLGRHRDYARFVGELFGHPTWQRQVFEQIAAAESSGGRTMLELITRLRAAVGMRREPFRHRFELATSVLMQAWARRASLEESRPPAGYVEELVSITLAVLSAPAPGASRAKR